MGTRSLIGKENANGTVTAIYCHWDGYPDHNGKILVNHYTAETKIDKLLDLGDLSSLGSEIGEKHDFDDRSHENWCTAYGRDRGEVNIKAIVYDSYEEFLNEDRGQNYVYVWRQGNGVTGSWYCYDLRKHPVDLAKFQKQAA